MDEGARAERQGWRPEYQARVEELIAGGMDQKSARKQAFREVGCNGRSSAVTSTDLVDPDRFQQQTLSESEINDWVAAHLTHAGLEPEDAPNSKAWNKLRWARGHETEFWTKCQARPKAAEEGREVLVDDGRPDEELLDRFEKSLERERAAEETGRFNGAGAWPSR